MTYRSSLVSMPFLATLWACSGSTLDVGTPPDASSPSQSAEGHSSDAGTKTCDIDNVTGTFTVTYTAISGDCGEFPSQDYQLAPNVLWTTAGCTVNNKSTSSDRCVSTGNADCVVGTAQEHIEGDITQTSTDALDGTISIAITSPQGQCSGKYAIAYRRK